MSKWLRRGFGQNNNTITQDERLPTALHTHSEFPSPPRNTMPSSSGAAAYHQTAPMPQYGTPAPATIAMDIDNPAPNSRSKYNSTNYHPQSTANSKLYERSRDDGTSTSRTSRRSTSVDRRTRTAQPSQPGYRQSTVGPQSNTPTPQQYASGSNTNHQSHATPSPGYNKSSAPLGTTTPPDSIQPSYPPPAVTSESPPSTELTQRRPAYLLHRDLVIGKGSYGQVCIASRGEPEGHASGRQGKRKKFACKCVMLRNDPKYIAKLQEEVNVLRELRGHDNVIRLYDVFCVDNELFIITELGRGGDLFHLLTTHPKHGVTEAYAGMFYVPSRITYCFFHSLSLLTLHSLILVLILLAKTVAEMLSAVAFLHSRSICHRDLKLENWVLESGKDVWSPLKLIDFGLSTHFSAGQRLSRVVGSSYYVAPEVLKKSYTEACDLWSLGVIVYMLLSGAPPFYGKNDEAIKASIVQGEYTFPHELFRDVSDEAMAFVSTLLSYNIEYRYTAEQALTHPWLANNVEREALRKAVEGARGIGIQVDNISRVDPMQM